MSPLDSSRSFPSNWRVLFQLCWMCSIQFMIPIQLDAFILWKKKIPYRFCRILCSSSGSPIHSCVDFSLLGMLIGSEWTHGWNSGIVGSICCCCCRLDPPAAWQMLKLELEGGWRRENGRHAPFLRPQPWQPVFMDFIIHDANFSFHLVWK